MPEVQPFTGAVGRCRVWDAEQLGRAAVDGQALQRGSELSLGGLGRSFTPPAHSPCSAEPDHRKLDFVIAKNPHFCKEVSL